MTNEKELLAKYNLLPIKISYNNKTKIITTAANSYTIKIKESPTSHIYQYLDSHNFSNYLRQINSPRDAYEIYPYIEEKKLDPETKALDLIYTLSLLHNKTTTYQKINLDEIKEKYEKIENEIDYLLSYYYDLQEYIENKVYMSPAEYLLIRNINLIYISLNNAKGHINEWYQLKNTKEHERQVFLHNNLTLDHFLLSDNNHLINWKKSKQDSPVYDFVNLYRKEYENVEMESLYNIYQSKYQYTKDEKILFYSLIELPWKITFKNTNYINTLKVEKLIDYLKKTNHFISKEYEKDQKTQQEELHK